MKGAWNFLEREQRVWEEARVGLRAVSWWVGGVKTVHLFNSD